MNHAVKDIQKNRPQAILFDLDGTLVDSAPDLFEAIHLTFSQLKLECPTKENIRQWIGNGVDKLLHRSLTLSLDGLAASADFLWARQIFFDQYQKQSGKYSTLYPDVLRLLRKLHQQKILLACITNKNRQFTIPLLEQLNIKKYFDVIVCGDDLSNKKPHPEPLIYAAKKLNVNVKQCLMVGDSISDIQAAKNAGAAIVCVDYGYSQGTDLKLMNVNATISNISQIEKYIVSII